MYMSVRHQEGLAHLLYGITVGGGFVALTGEVGTGKTTLCHCLLRELPQNIDIALILNPKMNALELLATICDELAIAYDKTTPTLKTLVDALNRYLLNAHAGGKRTVLLIDEAQNLSMEVLEQVRLLTNLETSKNKLLQIILVGQPELNQLLRRQDLRQLNQRITARYHLLPLSFAETRAYIRHRLHVCNGDPELFKESAVRKVYRYSSGIPRIINILCDRALLGAYANNVRVITPDIIKTAARETLASTGRRSPRLTFLLSLLLLSCVAFGAYFSKNPDRLAALTTEIKPAKKLPKPAANPKPAGDKQPVAQKAQIKPEVLQPAANPVKFDAWLINPDLTLNAGIDNVLKIWGKAPLNSSRADCGIVQMQGLNCLFGKATWKDLLSMGRPVILEFALTSDAKRYALLTGIRQGRAVIRVNEDLTFPLAEVLRYWSGRYMLLWQSPISDMQPIYPGQTSDNVLWLRRQLAVFDGINPQLNKPRYFDNDLKKRVKIFQHQHNLTEDGKAGVQTVLFLDNLTGSKSSPRLITTD
jgi:general secretion pathway protein A